MRADRRAALRLALPLLACLTGCSPDANGTDAGAHFASDVRTVEVVSTQIGGKNLFIPSTIAVAAGTAPVLSIYNTTDQPHGFRIEGLGVEAVLPAGEEYRLELPALEGGRIYRIHCQLHPPHRSATLLVLPGS